jgi:putative membrane protein
MDTPATEPHQDSPRDSFWIRICIIVGLVICAAVAFLILGPRPEGLAGQLDVSALPKVNATLNALTTVLLLTGFALIKARKIELHKKVMLSCFGLSTAFLCSYIVYHWFKAGPKAYVGDHRTLYLTILLSHILLASVIIPMALVTLYRGWNNQLDKHRWIARITLPTWLYVSVTGVIIYWMLYGVV